MGEWHYTQALRTYGHSDMLNVIMHITAASSSRSYSSTTYTGLKKPHCAVLTYVALDSGVRSLGRWWREDRFISLRLTLVVLQQALETILPKTFKKSNFHVSVLLDQKCQVLWCLTNSLLTYASFYLFTVCLSLGQAKPFTLTLQTSRFSHIF